MNATDGFPTGMPKSLTYSTTHQEYIWATWHFLQELRAVLKERTAEYGDAAPAYVPHHRDIIFLTVSVQLYACIAIESVMNFWATFRLGTKRAAAMDRVRGFERRFFEIARQISGTETPADDPVRSALKRLVLTRNELVHPRALVAGPEEDLPPSDEPPGLLEAEQARADMRCVLDFIVSQDSDMWGFLL